MAVRMLMRRSLQFVAATLAYLTTFALTYTLLIPPAPNGPAAADQPSPGLALVAVAALNVAVIGWMLVRSRWHGWRLAATMALVFYAVQTFLPQLEALIFPAFARHLPPGTLRGILLAGLAHALLWMPIAVLAFGKWRPDQQALAAVTRSRPALRGWQWRLPLAMAAYVALYFTFGYYVAWRNPAVAAYYGGHDRGTFLAQLQAVWGESPWLFGAQALRGLLWVLVALPVIRALGRGQGETMVALGLLFAVVMNAGLLLPNPYMPPEVRLTHLVETASANFLFGALVGWLFSTRTGDEHANLVRDSAPAGA